jgi:methyltransferase family protein
MADGLDEYLCLGGKPVLRANYQNFYDRIVAQCTSEMSIEIGVGIGNLKRRLPDVVSTDIQFAPWLDCIADAQPLPFADGSAANIVMVDVLHHLEFVSGFSGEAERLLGPGGRSVMVEPAITWGSTLFYRLLHQEPVPLVDGAPNPARGPYEPNQTIPTLIVIKHRERFLRLFPNFSISRVE